MTAVADAQMTKVCIDGRNLAIPRGSGIATYGHNLLAALKSLGLETHVLYGPPTARSAVDFLNEIALADANAPRVKSGFRRATATAMSRFGRSAFPVPLTGQIVWPDGLVRKPDAQHLWASQDVFDLAQRAFRTYRTFVPVRFDATPAVSVPDVLHWTCPMPLVAKGAINIYTIHDLIPLKLPHTTLDDKRAFHALCQEIVRRADHLITVSETTRQDVIRMLGADPAKVTNTYQAVEAPPESDRPQDDAANDLDRVLGLRWKEYFLYFGAIEPKKNLSRILQGYLASGVKTPLIVVAGRGWLAEEDAALLAEVASPERTASTGVRRLEYLPAPMLRALIRGARATVFPSLYEGFGLPVLESMGVGTAVLTSDGGALGEVAGDAAVKVDASDVDSIRDGFLKLDGSAELRAELAHRGRAQARRFSPEAYRERLENAYKAAGAL